MNGYTVSSQVEEEVQQPGRQQIPSVNSKDLVLKRKIGHKSEELVGIRKGCVSYLCGRQEDIEGWKRRGKEWTRTSCTLHLAEHHNTQRGRPSRHFCVSADCGDHSPGSSNDLSKQEWREALLPLKRQRRKKGFPGGTSGKEPACRRRWCKRRVFNPWVGKISWRRKWQPTPVFLLGESQG